MTNAGSALMGIGLAAGENRGVNAARAAVSSPLLEAGIEGARGILLNISGPTDLALHEVNAACELIAQSAHPDANIIFGTVIDDALGDEVRVTVIAAGFDRFDGERRSQDRRVVDLRYNDEEEEQESTGPLEELDVRDGELVDDDFDVPSFLNRS
jgi:cell division protein FtsZ